MQLWFCSQLSFLSMQFMKSVFHYFFHEGVTRLLSPIRILLFLPYIIYFIWNCSGFRNWSCEKNSNQENFKKTLILLFFSLSLIGSDAAMRPNAIVRSSAPRKRQNSWVCAVATILPLLLLHFFHEIIIISKLWWGINSWIIIIKKRIVIICGHLKIHLFMPIFYNLHVCMLIV